MEITLRQMPGKPSQNPAFLTTWLSSQDRQEADVLPASGNGAAGALMSPSTALRTTPPPPLCRSICTWDRCSCTRTAPPAVPSLSSIIRQAAWQTAWGLSCFPHPTTWISHIFLGLLQVVLKIFSQPILVKLCMVFTFTPLQFCHLSWIWKGEL